MTVLPIKLLTEVDQGIFGTNFINLAKLQRLGFPVAPGAIVDAPEIIIQTVLKHFHLSGKEVFEQRLTIVKKDLNKIPLPLELEKELNGQKNFFVGEGFGKGKKFVWQQLLDLWLDEIKNKIWRDGFYPGLTLNLRPRAVFYIKEKMTPAVAFFDHALNDVIIDCQKKLDPKVAQQIDQLVRGANRKLFLPQNYHLLITEKKVLLVGILPFTQTLPVSEIPQVFIPPAKEEQLSRLAVKVFLNLSSGFALAIKMDGLLLEGENLTDFDQAVFKISEGALSIPNKPVIYKLPDVSGDDLSGSLRLIHQKNLLDEAAKIFLFVRNKRNLLNVDIAVPFTRCPEELLQIKRELSAREVTRKGSLKLWWEAAVLENVINIEEYLKVGIDGVILDLDRLQKSLLGYEGVVAEVHKQQLTSLIKAIEPFIKLLHKAKIPVLVKGNLVHNSDILNFVIKSGTYGVVSNSLVEAEHLPDYLSFLEKRHVLKSL